MARPRTIAFQAVSVKISLSPSGVIIALVADRPICASMLTRYLAMYHIRLL